MASSNTSPEEQKLWRWMEDMAKEAERVRRDEAQLDEFPEKIDLFYGKHWPTTMPTFRPPIVINELRTLILTEASDLSETSPRIYVTKDPRKQGRDEQAERAFRAVWVRNQVDLKLTLACLWALIVGTGFLDVGWDHELEKGLGDVIVESRDPRTVLPDPDSIDDIHWQFCMTETVLDLAEIRRLFPIHGPRVDPEDKFSYKDPSVNPESSQTSSFMTPLYGGTGGYAESSLGYKKARARVLSVVVNDDSTEDVFEEEKDEKGNLVIDPETKKPKMKQEIKLKYPKGRRIIGANGVILFDGDNPSPLGDKGILRVILEPTIDRFWSHGFIDQTKELQLAADKLMSSVVENAVRLNNGLVIATGNTGVDWESFASIPGQVLVLNPGSEVKIQYPPPMPPDMVQAPWKMLDMQRRLLGFQEGRVGQGGRGNVSSDLTETEISQSQSPTRLRARMLYHTVQRLAEMIFARMAFGYTTKRYIPVVEGEAYKPVEWVPLDNPENYSIYVDPASFTIMSRTMLKRLGLALYKLRAVDRRSLLEAVAWPDWEQVSKRLEQQEMMAAMAKAKGKGGGRK